MIKKFGYTAAVSTCALMAVLAATNATAQESAQGDQDALEVVSPEDARDLDTVTVTGSRLSGGAQSESVFVFTADDIEVRGITNIDQLLRQFTSNNSTISASNPGQINGQAESVRGQTFGNISGGTVANLRGLGSGSTLVLLNGRRLAGEGVGFGDFVDIGSIPIDTIERVEVLSSGASAIYGADAVAGVINIIQKEGFNGTTINLRAGFSSSSADDYRASIRTGKSWKSGNLSVTGSYSKREAVDAGAFGIDTLDLRGLGGSDRRRFTSPQGVFYLERPNGDPDDIFTDNAYLIPNGFGEVDFDTFAEDLQLVTRDGLTEILPDELSPEQDTFAVSARLTQEIGLKALSEVYADVLYTNRNTKTEVSPAVLDIEGFSAGFSPFGFPFTVFDEEFGFEDTRSDIAFSYDFSGLADQIGAAQLFDTSGEDITLTGGGKGEFLNGWAWNAYASHSINSDISNFIFVDPDRIIQGDIDFDPVTFEDIVNVEPFNLLRGDFATNPDAIAALQSSFTDIEGDSQTDLTVLNGVIRNTLFEGRKPGGIPIALGAEYRVREFRSDEAVTLGLSAAPDVINTSLENSRRALALFGEISVPLGNTFSIDGAIRWEDVENSATTLSAARALELFLETGSDVTASLVQERSEVTQSDSGFSPRVGASWYPVEALKLRASYGESFRAPTAPEIGAPANAFFRFGEAVDPISGETLDELTVPVIGGGNVNLRSETSKSWTWGANFNPSIGDHDFNFSVDYITVDFQDRIDFNINFLPDDFDGTILREEGAVRGPDGNILYVYDGLINLNRTEIDSLDVGATHNTRFGRWEIDNSLRYSRQLKNLNQLNSGDEAVSRLGIFSPETQWVLSSSLTDGSWTLYAGLQYYGSFDDAIGQPNRAPQEVEAFATLDATVGYQLPDQFGFAKDTRIRVGATNLLDTDPPFEDSFNGFNSSFYDTRRRVFFVEVSNTF